MQSESMEQHDATVNQSSVGLQISYQNIQDSSISSHVPFPVPDNTSRLLDLLGGEELNLGLVFGSNILLETGVLSPELVQKIQKYRPNQDAIKLLNAIESEDLESARQIALNPEFCAKNADFVKSGQAIKKAVGKGFLEFAEELMERGFEISELVIVDGVIENDTNIIKWAIDRNVYSKESVELSIWYLIYVEFYDLARDLMNKEQGFALFSGIEIGNNAPMSELINNTDLLRAALKTALQHSYDNIACLLLSPNCTFLTADLIDTAISSGCIEFLKRVWLANTSNLDKKQKRLRSYGGTFSKESMSLSNIDKRELDRRTQLSYIIDRLISYKRIKEANLVLSWPEAARQEGVLQVLLKHGQQELAKEVIASAPNFITADDLHAAFRAGLYEVCVDMLGFKAVRVGLHKANIQAELIQLLQKGETCLPAIMMLNKIPNRHWNLELTKELCGVLSILAKKRYEIAICHAPILFCALVSEFLQKLSDISLQFKGKCNNITGDYLELAIALQDSIKEESELRYFLEQKDSEGRTVLDIYAENRFYTPLENEEIGTILHRYWNGSRKCYSIKNASTIYRSYKAVRNSDESMLYMKTLDTTRPYQFHYDQWTQSCNLRFYGQAASSMFLIWLYNMVIYRAIDANVFQKITEDENAFRYLLASQAWIISIIIEQILHFVFSMKTGRMFEYDNWKKMDGLMFLLMILIMLGFQNRLGNFENADPLLFNASIHSIIMILIWIRFEQSLLTFKQFGPLLRMIYLMMKEVVNFFIIFFCLGICSAAVFTALFNDSSSWFVNSYISVRTLFQAALGTFEIGDFHDNVGLGGVIYGIYLLIANIIFLNILIAIISNVYSEISTRGESEHRTVLISFYKKWCWDPKYGFLIFLPPPFTYISIILCPLFLISRDTTALNNRLCKIFYFIYAIPQFLVFLTYNLLYLPLLYIRGFVIFGNVPVRRTYKTSQIFNMVIDIDDKIEKETTEGITDSEYKYIQMKVSVLRVFIWIWYGIPRLSWSMIRDCYYFWKVLYQNLPNIEAKQIITPSQMIVTPKFMKDVQTVLKGLKTPTISVQQFVDAWIMLDQAQEQLTDSELQDRKDLASEYLTQFAVMSGELMIDVDRMRRILPYKAKNIYNEEYIQRAQHVWVPWFIKGIKLYQQKVGSMTIGNIAIPKKKGGSEISIERIEKLVRLVNRVESKYFEIIENCKSIRSLIDLQAEHFKQIHVERSEEEAKRHEEP